jgi:hypothetical protein
MFLAVRFSAVQFNALVVTPIVEKAKGTEAAKKELAELLAEAAEKVWTCCLLLLLLLLLNCLSCVHTVLMEPARQ